MIIGKINYTPERDEGDKFSGHDVSPNWFFI